MTSQTTKKHETVCITRAGFNFVRTEGADFAAKVTHQSYLKRDHVCFAADVKSELLIPRLGLWGESLPARAA